MTGGPGPQQKPRLVEGTDYYWENGKVVFTSTHHLRRGYCCHSRCRHCPYGTFGPHVPSPEYAAAASVVVLPPGSRSR